MYIGEAVSIFDNGLRRAIEAIVVCGGPLIYPLAKKRWLNVSELPVAQNFLTVIPIEGLGQHMSAKYRLMIPLLPVDEPCPVCRKVCLDSFGEHAVHCKELLGFKYRHDLVRDVLASHNMMINDLLTVDAQGT
ncbi:hypothetical protein Tco_0229440 [Tanacetum coccineum]